MNESISDKPSKESPNSKARSTSGIFWLLTKLVAALFLIIVALVGVAYGCFVCYTMAVSITFPDEPTPPKIAVKSVDYTVGRNTRFLLRKPQYRDNPTNPGAGAGLIVYIHSSDIVLSPPEVWTDALDKRNYYFIAPQNVGNGKDSSERMGAAVYAAQQVMKREKIDPNRVIAAGVSGGARVAAGVAFLQPDIFKGTIQSCGAEFYRSVQQKEATNTIDTEGNPYGHSIPLEDVNLETIKNHTRFVMITGSNDWRRGNIRDIYNFGYKQEGFKHVLLLDVDGQPHTDCDGPTLEKALDFIETGD